MDASNKICIGFKSNIFRFTHSPSFPIFYSPTSCMRASRKVENSGARYEEGKGADTEHLSQPTRYCVLRGWGESVFSYPRYVIPFTRHHLHGRNSKLFKGSEKKCRDTNFASRSVTEVGSVATTNIDIVALSVLSVQKKAP